MGGRGSSSGSGGIKESDKKPLGGGGSGGNWQEQITVYPFAISPQNLKASIGQKGQAIGIKEAMEGANPYYKGGSTVEFSENCQRAVVAYELRRRGYDVAALPTYKGDKLPSGGKWQGAFQKAKIDHVGASTPSATQKNLEAKMKQYGAGSRGIVKIPGHVFNVENVGGKVRYIDAQTNTVYNSKNVFSRVGRKSAQVQLIRTDNLRISERAKKSVTPVTDIMKRIAKNKK